MKNIKRVALSAFAIAAAFFASIILSNVYVLDKQRDHQKNGIITKDEQDRRAPTHVEESSMVPSSQPSNHPTIFHPISVNSAVAEKLKNSGIDLSQESKESLKEKISNADIDNAKLMEKLSKAGVELPEGSNEALEKSFSDADMEIVENTNELTVNIENIAKIDAWIEQLVKDGIEVSQLSLAEVRDQLTNVGVPNEHVSDEELRMKIFYNSRAHATKQPTVLYQTVHENYTEVPENFHDKLIFHVMTLGSIDETKCGGCQLLYELKQTLVDQGYTLYGEPDEKTPTCPSAEDLSRASFEDKTIVIICYEGIPVRCYDYGHGNVVHIRWILAPLGALGTDLDQFTHWGADDFVFHHTANNAFDPDNLPPSNIMQVLKSPRPGDETDFKTFPSAENRTKSLFYVGKATHFEADLTLHIGHGVEFQELEQYKMTPAYFVEQVLNTEYFYCYDAYTFYAYMAAMSGAVTIVSPFWGLTKTQWVSGSYVGEYFKAVGEELPGIAWGWDEGEIEYARRTMSELRGYLDRVRTWCRDVTVPRMARDAYRYAMGERVNFEGALYIHEAFPVEKNVIEGYHWNGVESKEGTEMKEEDLNAISHLLNMTKEVEEQANEEP